MKHSVSNLFALLLLIAVAVAAPAQTPTGALRGSVTDPNKAIISDAVVTVKNKQTGAKREVRSESSGEFFINSLLPGEYEVTVVAKGFKTHISSVTIKVGDTSTVEVALEVGDVSVTVVIPDDSTKLVNPSDYLWISTTRSLRARPRFAADSSRNLLCRQNSTSAIHSNHIKSRDGMLIYSPQRSEVSQFRRRKTLQEKRYENADKGTCIMRGHRGYRRDAVYLRAVPGAETGNNEWNYNGKGHISSAA